MDDPFSRVGGIVEVSQDSEEGAENVEECTPAESSGMENVDVRCEPLVSMMTGRASEEGRCTPCRPADGDVAAGRMQLLS